MCQEVWVINEKEDERDEQRASNDKLNRAFHGGIAVPAIKISLAKGFFKKMADLVKPAFDPYK
jgi:hypothetical protein